MADDYNDASDDLDPSLDDDQGGEGPEPKSSKTWLALITQSEKAFSDYQQRCDNIDRLFASLSALAGSSGAGLKDREFQLFWANIQVLAPSIYSRPPVPVVTTRFEDRRPIPRTAAELLERALVVGFERENIDHVMRLVRDDLAILNRGCAWVRYEKKDRDDPEKVCIDHADRKDFTHDPARNWKEVDWVAKRSWLSRAEMRKRFLKTSGKAYQNAAYNVQKDDKDNGASDGKQKAAVWEIWCKSANSVLWVAEGCDVLLDDDKPHLALEGFFPCPRPAYGTTQRRSLVPVPDVLYYRDQLDEINDLTARIAALSDSLKVRGFYPSGNGDIGEAIEKAILSTDDRKMLVGVKNWAMLGSGSAKDTIVWLPIDMVVQVLVQCVNLRKQLIEDVYQISGLSDIMRGATDPNETLGAQQLKSQYGSIRVRDRQDELVRFARDLSRIQGEIMAENFNKQTLLDMSQMDLPSDSDINKQIKELQQQQAQMAADFNHAQSDPQVQQMAQQAPDKAKEVMAQAQQQMQGIEQQIKKLSEVVTIDQVVKLLAEQKVRPFVLDIETDSTIQADENAEKKSRTEFLGVLASTLTQLEQFVQTTPSAASFAGEILKFAIAPYRAGRQLNTAVDEFVQQLTQQQSQPQPNPNPDQASNDAKSKMDQEAHALDMQTKQQNLTIAQQSAQQDAQLKAAVASHEQGLRERENAQRIQAIQVKSGEDSQKHGQDMQLGELAVQKAQLEIQKMGGAIQLEQQKGDIHAQSADIHAQNAELHQQGELLKQHKTVVETQNAEMPAVTIVAGHPPEEAL